MEVILMQEVPSLGMAGEIVKVKNGYARNYLLPQKKAVIKSIQSLAILEKQKDEFKRLAKKNNEVYQNKIDQIKKIGDLTITANTNDETKIFGSVTSSSIATILQKDHKIEINKKFIIIKNPIKSLGRHVILIQLNKNFQADIMLNVVPKNKPKTSEEKTEQELTDKKEEIESTSQTEQELTDKKEEIESTSQTEKKLTDKKEEIESTSQTEKKLTDKKAT